MMRVLLAFDKFKESMTAAEACLSAAAGLRNVDASAIFDHVPLSDGGDGFAECLTVSLGGVYTEVAVTGPLGDTVMARYGFVPAERLAILEMATASGLALVAPEKRNPWKTTTFGTGELIAHAAAQGAESIFLGVGGSATNDLGLGALQALGLRAIAHDGQQIQRLTPENFSSLQGFTGREIVQVPLITIACDVTNPLLGPTGSARIYGPQKGLLEADMDRMNREMERVGKLLCDCFGKPYDLMMESGSGAAGGISFGLDVALGAKRVPGFDLIANRISLANRVQNTDHVYTGEGRFDESSFSGKGPGGVIELALSHGKKVTLLCGSIEDSARRKLEGRGVKVIVIAPEGMELREAINRGPELLSASIGNTF